MTEEWLNVPFDSIETEKISQISEEYFLRANKCKKRMPQSTAVDNLIKLVSDFKETMPIVNALGNKYIEQYHWDEIKKLLNMEDFELEKKQWMLGQIMEFDIADKQEQVVHIATTAQQEFELRQQYLAVQKHWSTVQF